MKNVFTVIPSRPEDAARLAEIQQACFPTLAPDHLITPEHFRAQIQKFPEGQLSVIDEDGIIAASSGDMRINLDLNDYQHRYVDMVDHNWLTHHNPQGEWLYGFDIGVHPDYRGLGLSRLLYEARQNLARTLNLKGHIAGGMIKGYYKYKDTMSADDYVFAVENGDIFDPTLTPQLKRGFKVHGILHDYLDDPSCDNKAALIVWHNKDYKP